MKNKTLRIIGVFILSLAVMLSIATPVHAKKPVEDTPIIIGPEYPLPLPVVISPGTPPGQQK